MTVFEMPSPFNVGQEVCVTSPASREFGRVGVVTAVRGEVDAPGVILVKFHGEANSWSWHWSHFGWVEPLTGETVHPIVNRPAVPTK